MHDGPKKGGPRNPPAGVRRTPFFWSVMHHYSFYRYPDIRIPRYPVDQNAQKFEQAEFSEIGDIRLLRRTEHQHSQKLETSEFSEKKGESEFSVVGGISILRIRKINILKSSPHRNSQRSETSEFSFNKEFEIP